MIENCVVVNGTLGEMLRLASDMGIEGIAGVYEHRSFKNAEDDITFPAIQVQGKFPPCPGSIPNGNSVVNCEALVLSRIEELLNTINNGNKRKSGNFTYKDGIVFGYKEFPDSFGYIFFIGGTERQNLKISAAGLKIYEETLRKAIKYNDNEYDSSFAGAFSRAVESLRSLNF
ncbi:MAG: hypothetical protein HGB11_14460 [Chlorobiales bacterium]|nr:hypothetical protein [Chlorobiales bacterium]